MGADAAKTARRILVIDDDVDIAGVLKEYLESRPSTVFTVETAPNAKEGLAAAHRHRPDLVILDIEMPGMNGVEALKELRRLYEGIPVIMLTGNTKVSVAAETLVHGASSYAPKPLDFRYLEHLVTAFLPNPRPKPTT
ncbi:MAG: response regulator [Candidatus Rokuibacteriota bacterium]